MSRVRDYARTTVYLLIFCLPPAWALQLLMQLARVRSALGPNGNWPAAAVRWAIPDRQAAWRRRMIVWAQEVWQLTSGPRIGPAGVCRHLSITGIEHVREAVRSGDGAIVLVTHQMGLSALGWALMDAGLPWSSVAYVPATRVKWVDQWWNRNSLQIRAFGAQTLLNSKAAGIRQAYRRLRNGEVVAMPQDLPGERYRIRLLGRDASLALGSVRMAMATGAQLIPCNVVPIQNGGLQVCFRPHIDLVGSEAEMAKAVTGALQDMILSGPELWRPEFVYPETAETHGLADCAAPASDAVNLT